MVLTLQVWPEGHVVAAPATSNEFDVAEVSPVAVAVSVSPKPTAFTMIGEKSATPFTAATVIDDTGFPLTTNFAAPGLFANANVTLPV